MSVSVPAELLLLRRLQVNTPLRPASCPLRDPGLPAVAVSLAVSPVPGAPGGVRGGGVAGAGAGGGGVTSVGVGGGGVSEAQVQEC